MTDREREIVIRLIRAARPFTLGTIVDETDGTIPLMDELDRAIESACALVGVAHLSAPEVRAECSPERLQVSP